MAGYSLDVTWTLRAYLEEHDLKVKALAERTGLHNNSIYPLVHGEATRADLRTLSRVLTALRELTGQPTKLSDIMSEHIVWSLRRFMLFRRGSHYLFSEVSQPLRDLNDPNAAELGRALGDLCGGSSSSAPPLFDPSHACLIDYDPQGETLLVRPATPSGEPLNGVSLNPPLGDASTLGQTLLVALEWPLP